MIPRFVQPFLWSYDVSALNLSRDKKRIITNLLNLGTRQATDWLFDTYTKEDIKSCLINPLPGELDDKSINFWSLVLDIKPVKKTRFKK
ncbi:MAG: hypothetical protein WCT46_01675 [Candidatus Gracilibacteria bacterium]|jgi:hypothetical protein